MEVYDCEVVIKLKGKFYWTTIRPTMFYGSECWTIKKRVKNE